MCEATVALVFFLLLFLWIERNVTKWIVQNNTWSVQQLPGIQNSFEETLNSTEQKTGPKDFISKSWFEKMEEIDEDEEEAAFVGVSQTRSYIFH